MDDAWTPATTHVVIATPSGKRYWDDLATRVPHTTPDSRGTVAYPRQMEGRLGDDGNNGPSAGANHPSGAPLLDWWEIPEPEGDPMTTRYLVGDVFDRLAEIPDGSVDLVVTSPPFLALRSYLPADHPDKGREIGSEPTPAAFIDVMLAVTAELRRVLAPHGSIAVELGDTYAGGPGSSQRARIGGAYDGDEVWTWDGVSPHGPIRSRSAGYAGGGEGWPLPKSRTMIPQLYEVALAYGINPLTGVPSPAGRWRVRNVVTWCRPNPPVGALGDKWRPATSDVVVACVSDKRYWDDLATRTTAQGQPGFPSNGPKAAEREALGIDGTGRYAERVDSHPSGAPLLDYWVIPPKGYSGAHYAVYPQELVAPLVKAMCPQRVCLTCGEPSRRIVSEPEYVKTQATSNPSARGLTDGVKSPGADPTFTEGRANKVQHTLGFTDCGHDDWRPGVVLDPFAGSATTLAVAHGHGRDSVGIDLDERNAELAQGRLGMFLEVDDAAT